MLLLLYLAVVIFVPDIHFVSSQCNRSNSLTASSIEEIIEETKYRNLDCEWKISSTNHVEINITEWSLDQECTEDSLSIYDGDDGNDWLLAKVCGQGSSMIMVSSKQNARVSFRTGNRNSGRGFRMSYRSHQGTLPECPRLPRWQKRRYLKATENPQTITSQNYPDDYPRNDEEEWVIIKPSSSTPLAIVVEDSEIEESHNCGYDYLAVYNGKCYTDKKKLLLCGHEKTSLTLSGSQYVLVRFKSDSITTGRGFKLKYYLGTVEDDDSDSSTLHAILIGLIAACVIVILMLASGKLYMHCFKKQKVRPNQNELQNRRAMLEAQVRRGPHGSRLNRMLTAQSIHAEMTRYLNQSSTSEHDSRVSTFEVSSSHASGTGLVYQNGIYQPPSYNELFSHEEELCPPPMAPPEDTSMAPPPYPGLPDVKSEGQGQTVTVSHCSPIRRNSKGDQSLADVETVSVPPYTVSSNNVHNTNQ